MPYELQQIKEAYKKLRAYIYYDNTDILLRKKLVEFETSTSKDLFKSIFYSVDKPYEKKHGIDIYNFEQRKVTVEEKLDLITTAINEFHTNSEFMNYFLQKISVDIYPKSFIQEQRKKNFITNKRVEKKYDLDRVTAFINAPIEVHIISVLWIIEYGVDIDAKLNDQCLGNRLVLNKTKDKLVQGSSYSNPTSNNIKIGEMHRCRLLKIMSSRVRMFYS